MKRAALAYISALCSVALGGLATNACDSGDDSGQLGTIGPTPVVDASVDTGNPIGNPSGADSGKDTSAPVADAATGGDDGGTADSGVDAADSADSAVPNFCATQAGLAFCADFDTPGALGDAGATAAWDQVVGTSTEVAVSSAKSSSTPSALLVSLTDPPGNTDQSAKVVKVITPAGGIAQAIYEFDLYLDTLPNPGAGGFITDFQFSDTPAGGGGGQDQFGFRIAVFSQAAGGFDHAEFQHNAPAVAGSPPDDVVNPFPITAGAWNHVKISVDYALAADGGNSVAVKAFINRSATAAVDKTYDAPFAKAPFVRIADGVVYAFNGASKQWGVYFDNVTLKLQ